VRRIVGSPTLVRWLLREGLLDELTLSSGVLRATYGPATTSASPRWPGNAEAG
jgi:hypothetical protein